MPQLTIQLNNHQRLRDDLSFMFQGAREMQTDTGEEPILEDVLGALRAIYLRELSPAPKVLELKLTIKDIETKASVYFISKANLYYRLLLTDWIRRLSSKP